MSSTLAIMLRDISGLTSGRSILAKALLHLLVRRPAGRLLQIWRDALVLGREAGRMFLRHLGKCGAWLAAGVLLCVLAVAPHDLALLDAIQQSGGNDGLLQKAAWHLSHWGDFFGFNAVLLGTVYGLSLLYRSRYLRLVVVASLLSATLTGGAANVLRASLGRARPCSKLEPGFYGPSLSAKKHSCPSGHTATAFGGSIPVAVALPAAGGPLLVVAASIAWSRLENGAHHPSDVLFSCVLASVIGLPFGLLARRMHRHPGWRRGKYSALHRRARATAPPPSSCVPR